MPRKLFINGRIFTSAAVAELQDAMLIEDGRVVCVGTEPEVRAEMVVSWTVLFASQVWAHCCLFPSLMTILPSSTSNAQSFFPVSSTGTPTSSCSVVP